MNSSKTKPLSASILEEDGGRLSVEQLTEACAVQTEQIIEFVEEGVLDPTGREMEKWRFSAVSVRRVRIATRLKDDLNVNTSGAAMVLDLMDEIERLRARLRRHEADF